MFGRDRRAETSAAPVSAVTPQPPKTEWRCLEPSTFASRKAKSAAAPPPALVSLGTTQHVQRVPRQRGSHIPGDDVQSITVELYCERYHPARRYVRNVEDTVIHPLFADDGQSTEKVTPLGHVNAAGFRSGQHHPGRADQVTPID